MIRYKNPHQLDTKLHIIADNAVEPATEEEEYNGLMNPSLVDQAKIEARRNSYI